MMDPGIVFTDCGTHLRCVYKGRFALDHCWS
jgi:hypothetical protein